MLDRHTNIDNRMDWRGDPSKPPCAQRTSWNCDITLVDTKKTLKHGFFIISHFRWELADDR